MLKYCKIFTAGKFNFLSNYFLTLFFIIESENINITDFLFANNTSNSLSSAWLIQNCKVIKIIAQVF